MGITVAIDGFIANKIEKKVSADGAQYIRITIAVRMSSNKEHPPIWVTAFLFKKPNEFFPQESLETRLMAQGKNSRVIINGVVTNVAEGKHGKQITVKAHALSILSWSRDSNLAGGDEPSNYEVPVPTPFENADLW